MIRGFFILVIVVLSTTFLPAQTIRTDVLIIGSSAAGVSAGIQAARSGVKCLLIMDVTQLKPIVSTEDLQYLEKIRDHYINKTSAKSVTKEGLKPQPINTSQSAALIKNITDTVKNLSIKLNSRVSKIKEDGKGWEIKLMNGQKVKARIVVDATNNLDISKLLNIVTEQSRVKFNGINTQDYYNQSSYRTSGGAVYLQGANNGIISSTLPIGVLMPINKDNIIVISNKLHNLSPQMAIGQAAGASAAYCAFFKTSTKDLNIRVIQGELLAFDAQLVPYADISSRDLNARALQRIGLTGILKPISFNNGNNSGINFDTSGVVLTESLRKPIRELNSRSQIWFADNKSDTLTIDKAISLIKFIAARGNELTPEIEKLWKSSFKFYSVFDLKRPITRREFAVLADTYIQPFNVKVDLTGKLLN